MSKRVRDFSIALLFLIFGAYGLNQVMDQERWVTPTAEPTLAKLEEPRLTFASNPPPDLSDPAVSAREIASIVADTEVANNTIPSVPSCSLQPTNRSPTALFPIVIDASDSTPSDRYGKISMTPKFVYSRLDSVDRVSQATASFISNLDAGIDFSWIQHWSDFFETNLHGGFLKESFTTDTTKTVNNADHNVSNIGFGMKFSKVVDFTLGFDMRQRDFISANAPNVLEFDTVPIPQISAGLSIPILVLDPFTLSVTGNYAYLFSAQGVSYTINHGTAYDAGVSIAQAIGERFQLEGKFWYGQATQDTSAETQTIKEVAASIGLTYRFSNPSPKKGETP